VSELGLAGVLEASQGMEFREFGGTVVTWKCMERNPESLMTQGIFCGVEMHKEEHVYVPELIFD
jgi:hypothetical protein